jgi:hypothetical protein
MRVNVQRFGDEQGRIGRRRKGQGKHFQEEVDRFNEASANLCIPVYIYLQTYSFPGCVTASTKSAQDLSLSLPPSLPPSLPSSLSDAPSFAFLLQIASETPHVTFRT